ncbi:MAG: GNAT family N-acetyltransferase [Bacteroidota bacterium]
MKLEQGNQIKIIDHGEREAAEWIHRIFQRSYRVEAEILGATDFPPLKRTTQAIQKSSTTFLGLLSQGEMAAVAELNQEPHQLEIWSFVVDPDFFRSGIGSQLLDAIIEQYPKTQIMVETGSANKPAINLYEKKGFSIIEQWMTDFGIEKVRIIRQPH